MSARALAVARVRPTADQTGLAAVAQPQDVDYVITFLRTSKHGTRQATIDVNSASYILHRYPGRLDVVVNIIY
jgi:hypothetical protein